MGAYCQGEKTRGTWSEEKRKLHINVLELKTEKFAIQETFEQHLHLNGKHGRSFLSSKDGGDEQSGFSGIKLTNLELSHIKTDHSYCQAPTRNFECGGRLRVQKCEGLKRMNVEYRTCSNLGKPEINLACTESVETTHRIHITAQKMKFSIKDFFSKCDQIRRKRQFGHIY